MTASEVKALKSLGKVDENKIILTEFVSFVYENLDLDFTVIMDQFKKKLFT